MSGSSSVAAKWLLPESDSDAAARLLDDDPDVAFHVPELFDAELGNLLSKRVRRGDLGAKEVAATATLIAIALDARLVTADRWLAERVSEVSGGVEVVIQSPQA